MSELQMTVLEVNFDDAYDFELLPADAEEQVQVTKSELHKSEKGNVSLHLTLSVPDKPRVDDIHIYISVPTPELKQEDEKAYVKRLNGLKRAYEAFGIDTGRPSINPQEFEGQVAWAIIGFEPGEKGYPDKNTIQKWVQSA